MEYTREQMWRDLQVPALIVVCFVVAWSAITAFEASAAGQSFWSCLLHCSY
jgi:hypothetical protein